jgi:nucleolar protein 56
MKAYIAVGPIGVFAFDENGKELASSAFPKEPKEAANRIRAFQRGETLSEIMQVFNQLKADEIYLESDLRLDIDAAIESPNIAGIEIRKNLPSLFDKHGFGSYKKFLFRLNAELTKQALHHGLGTKDKRIIQAISAIDEIDDHVNVFSERLREWYGLYFPEMSAKVLNHESFSKLISKAKNRTDYKGDLAALAKSSIGAEFNEHDLNIVKKFAADIYSLYELRDSAKTYLSKLMEKAAPNLKAIAGELVGARLLAQAGSLEKLATMPSSTIQVLGAEKALFRHMTEGTKPPKYGYILHNPVVKQARRHEQGKIARTLAASISMAAKKDHYSGEFAGPELKKDLEKKIARIRRSSERKKK